MATKAPTPFPLGSYWVEIALGTAAAALVAAALAPSPASAGVFGRKKPTEDFTTARPSPIVAPPPGPATGAIFPADNGYAALYEGWRARRVGDPLTIVLVEKTAASKSSSSKLDSAGSGGLTPPTGGLLSKLGTSSDFTASGTRNFNGTGTADQANSLTGEITVTVAQAFPNGTLMVQGQKRVTLNRGDEYIRIKGLVRVADISADNRVASTRVADAQIAYTGKGDVARAGRQGWLSRFFQVVSPF